MVAVVSFQHRGPFSFRTLPLRLRQGHLFVADRSVAMYLGSFVVEFHIVSGRHAADSLLAFLMAGRWGPLLHPSWQFAVLPVAPALGGTGLVGHYPLPVPPACRRDGDGASWHPVQLRWAAGDGGVSVVGLVDAADLPSCCGGGGGVLGYVPAVLSQFLQQVGDILSNSVWTSGDMTSATGRLSWPDARWKRQVAHPLTRKQNLLALRRPTNGFWSPTVERWGNGVVQSPAHL